ncbi:MAG: hypothetical protein HY673_22260 [Chloroflexi bacterium]|nr:hypothetical protein [Chloroflexota bacterium]
MFGSSRESIILDASTLLNLYATAKLPEIISALPEKFLVADYVSEHEALYTRRKGTDGTENREAVDIKPLLSAGVLSEVRLNDEEEQKTFIDLAAELDDGEAVTIALAFHRQYTVATDDAKARRVASSGWNTRTTSALELMKRWSERAQAQREQVRAALLGMWSGASYRPGEKDPLYGWWQDMVSE